MKKDNLHLTLEETRLPKDQVREFVHNKIVTGEFSEGYRFPSTATLARKWNTHYAAVHAAFVELVKSGLLVRIHGRGTFVRKPDKRLTCVGIYFPEDVLVSRSSTFLLTIYAAIKEELNREGVRTQVWADPRPAKEQSTPWPELCQAIEQRKIQGLIVPAVDWDHGPWLNRLPVPSAYWTSLKIPNRVNNDLGQFAELGLHALAKQGCRSVGLITALCLAHKSGPKGTRNPYLDFFDRFTALAGDLGLTIRDEWMRLPATPLLSQDVSHERFGYEEATKLMQMAERPDGLVVFPDTIARGAILGLREIHARVPEDLKLVLHKNERFDLLCPMPATLAVMSEREIARALIEQVRKQFRGEPCKPITVDFALASTENETK
ncbi:MAG: substrate-binding domain-containing protein [Kiritimatiellae bacterium]|nr:substrate-binding domain-containing protein [Kiritimatiellia bacterium]